MKKRKFKNPKKQKISNKIDRLTKKYHKEYEKLAKKSEQLYDVRKSLKKEYKKLDKKTGLNRLLAKYAKLCKK